MIQPKIAKEYYTLPEVATVLDMSLDDLRYFGEEGKIAICLRIIPINIIIENLLNKKPYTQNPKNIRQIQKIINEPQPIHTTDIYRIFANRFDKIKLTRLKTLPIMNLVKITNADIMVGFDDLIITKAEKEKFEFLYLHKPINNIQNPLVIISPDFMNFTLIQNGKMLSKRAEMVII